MAATQRKTTAEKVVRIPIDQLHFMEHYPIAQREDDSFHEIVNSVRENGVLQPAIVRPLESGGYEIITGRRRKLASELAELSDMPCIVRKLDDDQAIIEMVDSDIHREDILPSEKGAAYKMKLEAIKRQGKRREATSRQDDGKLEAADIIGAEAGESGRTVQRYIRLTNVMHLLLKEEQTAAYSVEIWKRFRKWGGIPTGLTQNVKDLLSSREVENIFENSDYVCMLNQASGDRQILAKQLNISPHQLSYVTHSGEGERSDGAVLGQRICKVHGIGERYGVLFHYRPYRHGAYPRILCGFLRLLRSYDFCWHQRKSAARRSL